MWEATASTKTSKTPHKVSVTRHLPPSLMVAQPRSGFTSGVLIQLFSGPSFDLCKWWQGKIWLIRALYWKWPYFVNTWHDSELLGWTQRGTHIINPLQAGQSIGTKRLESKGSLNTTPNMVSFEPIEKSLPLMQLVKCFCPCRSSSKALWKFHCPDDHKPPLLPAASANAVIK